jgi:hypothetical protein
MYSPAWGRFLQPDPTGYAGSTNLYAYAGDDPLNATDPSGEYLSVVGVNGGTVTQGQTALWYLSRSPTASADITRLESSSRTYTMRVDPTAPPRSFDYNPANRTIMFNPISGLILNNSQIQSPAIGAGHELDHAAQQDLVGTQAFMQSLSRSQTFSYDENGLTVTMGTSPEEVRATTQEAAIAQELNEPARVSHGEGQPVTVLGPTSTTPAPAGGAINTIGNLPK